MRALALFCAVLLPALTPPDANAEQFHLWSHGFGDTLFGGVAGVAVDTDGGVVIAGNMSGTFDFGGGPLVSAGGADIFIARFSADGVHLWSHRYGDAARQFCRAMAMGPNGDIVITGDFTGTVNFGGGPLTAADDDIFIACFDRDGTHRWSKGFARAQPQFGRDIAVDADGSVLVTGSFAGRVDFGGGLLSSFGGYDVFMVKYDPDGNHLWSKRFGDGLFQEGECIAVDASGNVVLAGRFLGTIDLGGGVLTSAGDNDIYLGRWDAAGNPEWSRRYGDNLLQAPLHIACAPGGDIALTGFFAGRIDFGGGPLVTVPPNLNVFLAVFSADATHRWSLDFPSTEIDRAAIGPVALSDERMVVAGSLRGFADIQGHELVSAGGSDVLVLEFDADGNVVDTMVRGRQGDEHARGVAATADGGIVVTGDYSGESNLGGEALPALDIFLAAYSPEDPFYTPIAGFSAVLRGGIVQARWQFAIDDPSAMYRLVRRSEPDSLWITLSEGTAEQHSGGYDDASVVPGRAYSYRLHMDTGSREYASQIATVQVPPATLLLRQNAPNPFPGVTTLRYAVSDDAPVVIRIYDAAGRRISRLDQGFRFAGEHEAVWDGRDESGRPCASGVYFYSLEGIPAAGARKMVLLR